MVVTQVTTHLPFLYMFIQRAATYSVNKISLKYIFYMTDLDCEGFYESPLKPLLETNFGG